MTTELAHLFDIGNIGNMTDYDKIPSWDEYVEGLKNSPHKNEDIDAVLRMDISSIEEISLANALQDFISITTDIIGEYELSQEGFKRVFLKYNNRLNNLALKYINAKARKGEYMELTDFLELFFYDVVKYTDPSYLGILQSRLESCIEDIEQRSKDVK